MLSVLTTWIFSFVRSNTTQFPRSFIPAVIRFWNDLPNHVEFLQLRNFKCSVNAFLLSRLF